MRLKSLWLLHILHRVADELQVAHPTAALCGGGGDVHEEARGVYGDVRGGLWAPVGGLRGWGGREAQDVTRAGGVEGDKLGDHGAVRSEEVRSGDVGARELGAWVVEEAHGDGRLRRGDVVHGNGGRGGRARSVRGSGEREDLVHGDVDGHGCGASARARARRGADVLSSTASRRSCDSSTTCAAMAPQTGDCAQ